MHLRTTEDGAVLISAGADGCLAVWEVLSRDRTSSSGRGGVSAHLAERATTAGGAVEDSVSAAAQEEDTSEVLVDEKYLQEIEKQLQESNRQIEDLTAQTAFKIRTLESQQQEALRQMEEKCESQLAQERCV